MYRSFQRTVNSDYVLEWKSKGLSDESTKSPSVANNFIYPKLSYYGNKMGAIFSRSCLNQDKITYSHGKIVSIYVLYEISRNYNISSYPTLENFLFGGVSLTRNADIDKYKYSG